MSNKSIEHIPFMYHSCMCKDCSSSRERKERERVDTWRRETLMEQKFGPNWKNIFSGLGDQ